MGKADNMIELPDKPSELIKLALKKLELIEKDFRYRVTIPKWPFGIWHGPRWNGRCYVCLAGVLMACLGVPSNEYAVLYQFDRTTQGKLQAVDELSRGEIYFALISLGFISFGLKNPPRPRDRFIFPYFLSRKRFKRDMYQMAKELDRVGL